MDKWTNVHIFDGECKSTFENIEKIILEPITKIRIYGFFENKFKKPEALKALKLIQSGQGNKAQFADYLLDAEDLLCACFRVYFLLKEEDILNLMEEQLCDMINTNGTCPSGRCTRLLQIATIKK